ncbi:hypothetical protein L0F63_006560 [Massospora cicadina]|nr:hypothetical protein L0F63_006560 [Massospora cicadina]
MESYINRYIETVPTEGWEADSVLQRVISGVEEDELTVLELVNLLQEVLVSEEPSRRARGLALLTGVLEGISSLKVTPEDAATFAQFYVTRLHDQDCLAELLHGLKAIQSISLACGPRGTLTILQGLFDAVRVQQLSQPLRLVCFSIFLESLVADPGAIRGLGQAFVKGLVEAIDGEKDPRNLLLVFDVVRLALQTCDVQDQVEDLFDVTFCYFPITFKVPKEDPFGVSPAALKAGLSTPLFDTLAIPALLRTLSSTSLNAKRDALDVLLAGIPVYRVERLISHLGELVSSFVEEVYHPLEDDVQAAAFKIVEVLFTRLLSTVPINVTVECELSKVVGAAIHRVLDKDNLEAKFAGRLALALARSSAYACNYVASEALAPILRAYKEAELVTQRKLLLEVVAGLVGVYTALPDTASIDPLSLHQSELLVCFAQALDVISEYNELRKTAIEGLSALVALPSISTEERRFFTLKLAQTCLADEDAVVRKAALEGVCRLARVADLASAVLLPHFFGGLESLSQSPPRTAKAASALEAILKLSYHPPLFTTILDRVVLLFDAECQRKDGLGDVGELLSCLEVMLGDHIEHHQQLPDLVASVVLKLWRITTLSALGTHDYTPAGSTPQVLETISHITILALRWVDPSVQAWFLGLAHKLCFEAAKPDEFGPLGVADFFPFSASSPHARMSILYASALAPCCREVALPCSSRSGFVSSLVEACFASPEGPLRKSICITLAVILNKFAYDDGLVQFVEATLKSDLKFIAFDYSAPPSRRGVALDVIVWAAGSLVKLGHDAGFQLLDFISMLLEDDVLGRQAALGFEVVLGDDPWFVCAANRGSVRLLYRQRVFSILFPILTALFHQEACRDEVKQNCLVALTALLDNSPSNLLIREGNALLPLLVCCLNQASEPTQEAALATLLTVMAEGGLPESGLRFSFFHHNKPTLLETLLALATRCDGSKRRFGIQVRMGALKCLALVPSLTALSSAPSADSLDRAALCRLVCQRLSVALDDPKRLVRAEAVKCRHAWLAAATPPK